MLNPTFPYEGWNEAQDLCLTVVIFAALVSSCVNIMSSGTDDTSRYKPGNTANQNQL